MSTTGERAVARRAAHPVAVVGDPVEIALYLMGRTERAQVELRGAPANVAALRRFMGDAGA